MKRYRHETSDPPAADPALPPLAAVHGETAGGRIAAALGIPLRLLELDEP